VRKIVKKSRVALPLGRDEKINNSKPQSVCRIAADLQFDSVVSGSEAGERAAEGVSQLFLTNSGFRAVS